MPKRPEGPPLQVAARRSRPLSVFEAYFRILRSGVFMHSAYALRYLGTRRNGIFALPHFLLRGEKQGCRANPFIDPVLRDDAGRRVSLAEYLGDDRNRTLAPSRDFDPAWYRSQMAGSTQPLLHFWSHGFAARMNPAPDFDLHFVKEAIAVFRPDKAEYLYELAASDRADFPRNEAELVARQNAFRAAIDLAVLRDAPTGRPFLVFVQAAHDYLNTLGSDPSRYFDVLVNIYDKQPPARDDLAEIVVAQAGTKTTAIHKLLEAAPDVLLRYEAVLFLDDDIEIDADRIEQLFAVFAREQLDLAQPSLTADSWCAYGALKQPQAGSGVRPISMVEIMMPVVSRRALQVCGSAFGEAVSGWGVDALISQQVRQQFGDTIALIADVVAAHRRGVDLEGGALYRYLRSFGIDPEHEIARIALRFGTSPFPDAVHFID